MELSRARRRQSGQPREGSRWACAGRPQEALCPKARPEDTPCVGLKSQGRWLQRWATSGHALLGLRCRHGVPLLGTAEFPARHSHIRSPRFGPRHKRRGVFLGRDLLVPQSRGAQAAEWSESCPSLGHPAPPGAAAVLSAVCFRGKWSPQNFLACRSSQMRASGGLSLDVLMGAEDKAHHHLRGPIPPQPSPPTTLGSAQLRFYGWDHSPLSPPRSNWDIRKAWPHTHRNTTPSAQT